MLASSLAAEDMAAITAVVRAAGLLHRRHRRPPVSDGQRL